MNISTLRAESITEEELPALDIVHRCPLRTLYLSVTQPLASAQDNKIKCQYKFTEFKLKITHI